MEEKEIKNQISNINQKLDLVLQYVEQQRLKTQEVEDLVKDVSIVGNDMFKATVEELEHNSVELDTEELRLLLFRMIKNVGNINQVMAMFESMNDFAKDMGPVVRGMTFDLIAKIEEYEQKGYFEIFKNLGQNMDKILNVFVMLTKPEVINSFEKMTKVLTTVKMDDELDNKSLFKIYKQMKKPEVRKSISYSLRLVQEIHKELHTESKINK